VLFIITYKLDKDRKKYTRLKGDFERRAEMFQWPTGSKKAAPLLIPYFLSLKGRGYLFIVVLIIYGALLTYYGLGQKHELLEKFHVLHGSYISDWAENQADIASFVAFMEGGIINSDIVLGHDHIVDHLVEMEERLDVIESRFTGKGISFDEIRLLMSIAKKDPSDQNLNNFYESIVKVREKMNLLVRDRRENTDDLAEQFESESEKITLKVTVIGLMGMLMTMIIVGRFFTNMTHDLDQLIKRSVDIVKGKRIQQETSPEVKRRNKVGELAMAIERMAIELENRDRQLEIERKKIYHQEKMAAIGTLAAGIAHEVGNPIAAISALAVETRKSLMDKLNLKKDKKCHKNIGLILQHTERLAVITREISEVSTPQSSKLQWFDLNVIVQNTANLMRYDMRYRNLDLQFNLDSQMPAVMGKGDQISQVFINLLINSADSLAGIKERPPTITCSTAFRDETVILTVTDNGCGMSKDASEHALEAFYTTKPAGKGTGLGLSLCHSIIDDHGGKIKINSTPNMGTIVEVFLPIDGVHFDEGVKI
jgi:C4-dicarboxylate-specific signal transduction histidine kinase